MLKCCILQKSIIRLSVEGYCGGAELNFHIINQSTNQSIKILLNLPFVYFV